MIYALDKIKKYIFFKQKENKIYDCFLFFNENDLLEIRLNELNHVVDYFVILESNLTFTKKEKGFKLDLKRFEKFKNKIIYIQNFDCIKSPDPWEMEKFQRNKLIDGLNSSYLQLKANDNDMIILSDLDEIPKSSAIINSFYEIYKNNYKYIRLEFNNFRYAFNNTCQEQKSISCIISKKQNLESMQQLRINQKADLIIKNSGWHYSFLTNPEDIIYKIVSYSHKEYDKWPNNDVEFIKKRIYNGQSNFAHEESIFKTIKLNKKNCPKHILKNKKKYDKLIFEHEKKSFWSQIMLLYNKKICKIKEYTLGIRNKSSQKINNFRTKFKFLVQNKTNKS